MRTQKQNTPFVRGLPPQFSRLQQHRALLKQQLLKQYHAQHFNSSTNTPCASAQRRAQCLPSVRLVLPSFFNLLSSFPTFFAHPGPPRPPPGPLLSHLQVPQRRGKQLGAAGARGCCSLRAPMARDAGRGAPQWRRHQWRRGQGVSGQADGVVRGRRLRSGAGRGAVRNVELLSPNGATPTATRHARPTIITNHTN